MEEILFFKSIYPRQGDNAIRHKGLLEVKEHEDFRRKKKQNPKQEKVLFKISEDLGV